eukprot:1458425-Ditylum_brightwellii.AAC.1
MEQDFSLHTAVTGIWIKIILYKCLGRMTRHRTQEVTEFDGVKNVDEEVIRILLIGVTKIREDNTAQQEVANSMVLF